VRGLARVARRRRLPQLVDDPVDRHERAAMDEQEREERERAPPRNAAGGVGLDRPEDAQRTIHTDGT
jgi:hypothetical protein